MKTEMILIKLGLLLLCTSYICSPVQGFIKCGPCEPGYYCADWVWDLQICVPIPRRPNRKPQMCLFDEDCEKEYDEICLGAKSYDPEVCRDCHPDRGYLSVFSLL